MEIREKVILFILVVRLDPSLARRLRPSLSLSLSLTDFEISLFYFVKKKYMSILQTRCETSGKKKVWHKIYTYQNTFSYILTASASNTYYWKQSCAVLVNCNVDSGATV